MQVQAKPFYRPASKSGAWQEDVYAINEAAGLYLVADGVSGPYSPSNPPLWYLHNGQQMSGGRMVSSIVEETIQNTKPETDLSLALVAANDKVFRKHQDVFKSPLKEAVAGACVAVCQVRENDIVFTVGGDSRIFWQDDLGVHCLSNFGQTAFDFEERGDQAFQECLNKADGNIGKAWDFYFKYFSQKQFFRANRNRSQGGHAMLNGDPAFYGYLDWLAISLPGVQWVVLCTDGLLPKTMTNPKDQKMLVAKFGGHYEKGGISQVVSWRDSFPNEPHIGPGWPEATALEILLT